MADDRELLSALASGLRELGVPDPDRCWLRTRWDGTDHVLGSGRLQTPETVRTWVTGTVARDALALLRAELGRMRVRYPHLASKCRWPRGWPDPPTRHMIYAGSGLPYFGHNDG